MKEGVYMSSNQKKICVGLIITILAIVGFYFFYWIKTPVYSINLIREAVKHRNIEAFERHVDLNSVYSKAVDDFFVVAINLFWCNIRLLHSLHFEYKLFLSNTFC